MTELLGVRRGEGGSSTARICIASLHCIPVRECLYLQAVLELADKAVQAAGQSGDTATNTLPL